jgi:hypothetical protein
MQYPFLYLYGIRDIAVSKRSRRWPFSAPPSPTATRLVDNNSKPPETHSRCCFCPRPAHRRVLRTRSQPLREKGEVGRLLRGKIRSVARGRLDSLERPYSREMRKDSLRRCGAGSAKPELSSMAHEVARTLTKRIPLHRENQSACRPAYCYLPEMRQTYIAS